MLSVNKSLDQIDGAVRNIRGIIDRPQPLKRDLSAATGRLARARPRLEHELAVRGELAKAALEELLEIIAEMELLLQRTIAHHYGTHRLTDSPVAPTNELTRKLAQLESALGLARLHL